YDRMAAYFASIGVAGARMMRQTASVQVCLDVASDAALQWRVLNAAALLGVAIFASSPRYAGALTDEQSVRAGAWRALDPLRTGLPYGDASADAYLRFALEAPSIFHRADDGSYAPFGELLATGRAKTDDWDAHLSTLFPEVRPRGYLEVRSADAIDPAYYAAPLALLAGISYHAPALRAAAELLGSPSDERLAAAGRAGLRDAALARDAVALVDIALAGCTALGPEFFAPRDLDEARAFFDRYTRTARAPADDARERVAAV
ncbi:MAG: glutamate-cysteine ligase family protein, partial [Gemmatimonadaceae bacterium]